MRIRKMPRILFFFFSFKRCLRWIWGLFVPELCQSCGRHLLPNENCLCRLCLDELPATMFETIKDNDVEKRMSGRVPLFSAFSCFYFRRGESLRTYIHGFKYHGQRELAREMGREMGRRACRAGFLDGYDYLVPVPLHPSRLAKRGYNQSQLIAEGVSEVSGVPVLLHAVERVAFDGSQTHLNAEERYLNARRDFALGPKAGLAAGRTVLIIDDVFTTGATCEACVEPLLRIEGLRVGLATLAYAVH